ncbi:MAG: FGGY family carbohydrate kinase [Actinomycetota bacterium]|nr:FGGY family carbohydrate kinase [Actinomycetota bacterium]
MSRERVVVGVDVGTTSMKAAAFALNGRSVGEASVVTCWDVGAGGETDMDVERLTRDFIDLVAELVETTGTQCIGIGITGMAETGVVVDEYGAARHRAFAWFDQRGAAELDDLPPNIRDAFAGTTGLALKAECSLSKLLWLQAQGFTINAGDVWLNAQEFLGFRLTGTRATEPSLASRTALWDQDGRPWTQALDLIGVSEDFIPPFVAAGTSLGVVGDGCPESMRGAVVTVTGHDHLVAAIGSGAVGSNQLFNSCGTADVLVRSVPWVIDADSRAQLVAGGLSVGRHALGGHTAVLGATRFGLVMERVMAMLGVHDHAQRAHLVDAWRNEGSGNEGSGNDVVSVSEPGGWVNEVRVSLHDTCSPDQVVAAAVDYGIHSMRGCLETMTSVTGPSDQVIAGGGWAQLDGVLRAKGSLLADLSRSTVSQPGVRGAAAFAGIAAGMTDEELTRELASHVQPPRQHPQQEKQKETVS